MAIYHCMHVGSLTSVHAYIILVSVSYQSVHINVYIEYKDIYKIGKMLQKRVGR